MISFILERLSFRMSTQKKKCNAPRACHRTEDVHINSIMLAFTYSKSSSSPEIIVHGRLVVAGGVYASNVDVFLACAEYSMQEQRLQKHSFAPRGTNSDKSLSGQSKPKNKGTAPLLLYKPDR